MANISVRMDDNLKQQTEMILDELGLNMSTAVTMLAKAIVRERRLPLDLSLDPFYSTVNQAVLSKRIAAYEADHTKVITKTLEELEEAADGE